MKKMFTIVLAALMVAALFAGCSIGRIKIEEATKACLPFYAMMILVLMLITFWQPLSMFVPSLMMG